MLSSVRQCRCRLLPPLFFCTHTHTAVAAHYFYQVADISILYMLCERGGSIQSYRASTRARNDGIALRHERTIKYQPGPATSRVCDGYIPKPKSGVWVCMLSFEALKYGARDEQQPEKTGRVARAHKRQTPRVRSFERIARPHLFWTWCGWVGRGGRRFLCYYMLLITSSMRAHGH